MSTIFSKSATNTVWIALISGLCVVGSPVGICLGQTSQFDLEQAGAEFDQEAAKWREMLIEINSVTIQYQNAEDDEVASLRSRHRELEQQARLQFSKLFEKALEITQQAPGEDGQVTQFLLMATFYRFNHDSYELTGEAAEALIPVIEGGRGLPEIAGVSYWATSQYEKARPFLEQAVSMGLLDEKNRGVLPSLDRLKEEWAIEKAKLESDKQADDLPRVRLATTRGDVVLELFENEAPNTVANFIELVDSGAYRNVPFYQVLEAQVALAGDTRLDPTTMGFALPDENQLPDSRKAFRGYVAMAKLPMPPGSEFETIPNSASSHFFLTYRPIAGTSSEHTIFGRIIEGMEHFASLKRVDPSAEKKEGEKEETPDFILEAEVIRKRDHNYEPNRIDLSSVSAEKRQ